jgi:hypothetical protein
MKSASHDGHSFADRVVKKRALSHKFAQQPEKLSAKVFLRKSFDR